MGENNISSGSAVGTLQVERAAGALGAYVSGTSLTEMASSVSLFDQFRQLVVEHEVLFLRQQHNSAQEFQAFARCFGPVLGHPAYDVVDDAGDVQILESTAAQPSKIETWHSDMTFSAAPPSFTILHGQIIPPYGGDTMWASATAAYAALSETMRHFFDELVAVHDFCHGFKESLAEPGGEERLADAIPANPPVEHPLVRTHPETGKRSLYVNSLFTSHIKGLNPLESDRLLSYLYQHIVTPEFTVRLSWQPGTVAVWDNRSTQHKPVNDFFPAHRKMHRVTIAGGRPE